MTAPTLAQIRRIHEAQHGGYIGDCTCRVDGQLCQVVYREAEACKSDKQIADADPWQRRAGDVEITEL